MHGFLRLVLRFKLVVILLTLAVLAGGAWSATQLRQQLFPDIAFPFAVVKVQAPGVPPAVLDDRVAAPLARSVEDVEGVRDITTVASDGVVTVYGELDLGVDVRAVTREILRRMRAVDLPAGTSRPAQQGAFTEQPVLIASIVGGSSSIEDLSARVVELRAELLELDGVAKVEVPGAVRQQVRVQLTPAAAAAGFDPAYVLELLGPDAATASAAELQRTPLPRPVGRMRTVGDIARVSRGADPGAGFAISNGRPSIAVRVQREPDANEVDVVDSAQQVLRRFDSADDDVRVVTLSENATAVKASIRGLLAEGVLGAAGAVLVIFIFLRSGRGTLIAAVSIPTSIVFGLLVGYWLDLTLDVVTLAGLTIAVGRVIDDAIVVIENVSKHVERGEDVRDAVVEGTSEVATAIVASTAATVAVFLPLGFLGGFISSLFQSFSIIVAVSLAASLLVAITVIPVLAELMFRQSAGPGSAHADERGRLERWVRPLTAFGLRQRLLTVGVAVASVAATVVLVATGAIPTQFLPDSSVQQVYGTVTLPPGQGEEQARERLSELSEILDEAPGVVDWQYSFGTQTIQLEFGAGPNTVTFVANLEEEVDGGAVVERIRARGAEAYPDAFSVAQLENGPPAGTFQANVKASDPETLRSATQRIVELLKARSDLTEVSGSRGSATLPQLEVTPLDEAAGVEATVRLRRAVAAYSSPAIDESGDGPSIAVLPPTAPEAGGAADAAGRSPLELLSQLPAVPVGERDGAGVGGDGETIGDRARLSISPQLAFVARSDGRLVATVDATIEGQDTAGVTADIKAGIAGLERSGELGDVAISYEGDAAFVQQMFRDLVKAIVVAVVLVAVVLTVAFRSFIQPLAMLAPVLFSTFGAFAALALTRNALGLPAMIGQLLLIGIVVANAILLVDAVVRMRRRGTGIHQALEEAAVLRVRPVLMTAFATMAALTPLALGISGEGGIVSRSLGVVVIGGLALATFGTLVIVPAAYSLIARGRRERV